MVNKKYIILQMIDSINIMTKTERDFSIKIFVLNKFKSDETTVKVKALMPIKV